jgi:hypothetical protein
MKFLKIIVFLFVINISFAQEVKIKELSPTKFKIEHIFTGSESHKEAYQLRLFSLFPISSLEIKENYVLVNFNPNESIQNIEQMLMMYSKAFNYSLIKIEK